MRTYILPGYTWKYPQQNRTQNPTVNEKILHHDQWDSIQECKDGSMYANLQACYSTSSEGRRKTHSHPSDACRKGLILTPLEKMKQNTEGIGKIFINCSQAQGFISSICEALKNSNSGTGVNVSPVVKDAIRSQGASQYKDWVPRPLKQSARQRFPLFLFIGLAGAKGQKWKAYHL